MVRRLPIFFLAAALLGMNIATPLFADAPADSALGRRNGAPPEFSSDEIEASPKEPWRDFPEDGEKREAPVWSQVLLWLPNRLIDLWDVFRVDVGAGPAIGAVARISRYGQVGYRQMAPMSVRIGDFGRKEPVLVESSNEMGIGPIFKQSKDRTVCKGELGLGLDLGLGAYVGICSEELFDFAAGIFFLDPADDDIR